MNELQKIIETIPNKLVQDTAMYCMTRASTDRIKQLSLITGQPEIRMIHPVSMELVDRYERGFINNDFWKVNQAGLQASLFNEQARTVILYQEINKAIKEGDTTTRHIKALFASRFETVVLCVALSDGYDAGIEFASTLYPAIRLTDDENEYIEGLINGN